MHSRINNNVIVMEIRRNFHLFLNRKRNTAVVSQETRSKQALANLVVDVQNAKWRVLH